MAWDELDWRVATAAFAAELNRRGVPYPAGWRTRLGECGTGPVGWWYREGVVVGVHQKACNLSGWCRACEWRRVSKGRQLIECALDGQRSLEMWTLTAPLGDPNDGGERRRKALLTAWGALKRKAGLRVWAAGQELVPPTHWHLHVLVPEGTAHALGKGKAQKSWTGFRLVWTEAVKRAWPELDHDGVCMTWVTQTRGRGRTREGKRVETRCQLIDYVAKYVCKTDYKQWGPHMTGQWAGRMWRRKRVLTFKGAAKPGKWTSVPGEHLPDAARVYDGEEARRVLWRAFEGVREGCSRGDVGALAGVCQDVEGPPLPAKRPRKRWSDVAGTAKANKRGHGYAGPVQKGDAFEGD